MIIDFETNAYKNDSDVEIPVRVVANVEITSDMYGTGDSPTGYDVVLLSVVDEEDNNVINDIDGPCMLFLEEQAAREIDPEVTFY